MTINRANNNRRQGPLFKWLITGLILTVFAVGFTVSEIYGFKQKRIIKRDFEELYPDFKAIEYDFDLGEVNTYVKITYIDTGGNENFLRWEYVKWYKIGWINIDSSDAEIITIDSTLIIK